MTCKDIENRLYDIAEGEDFPDKEMFLRHLEGCPYCQRLLEEIQAGLLVIEREKELRPNPFLATRVLERVKQEERIARPKFFLNNVALLAAMLVGVFVGLQLGTFHYETNVEQLYEQGSEISYFDDFGQEPIEYHLISEEEWVE